MKDDGVFPDLNLDILIQKFYLESYYQKNFSNGFIPYLSVLDASFNASPKETNKLIN